MQLVLVVHCFSWLTGLLVQMDHRCRWSWWFTGSVGSLVMTVCIAGEDGSLVQMVQVVHWFSWLTGLLVQMVLVVHPLSLLTDSLVQIVQLVPVVHWFS